MQKFVSIKNGLCVIKLQTYNTHTKFQGNIVIFGCAVVRKPGKRDDVTFATDFFLVFLTILCTYR